MIPRKEKEKDGLLFCCCFGGGCGGWGVKLFESVSWFHSLDISVPYFLFRSYNASDWKTHFVCGVFYISNMLPNQSVYQICVHMVSK